MHSGGGGLVGPYCAENHERSALEIAFTAERSFQDEVRQFLAQNLPADIRDKVHNGRHLLRDDWVRWQKILHAKGWGAVGWPVEFGGTGWTGVQQHIFEEEQALAGAPRAIPFGLKMVAPVIMKFGNRAQQERFLPRIVSMDDWWCQGYSETGSGSDLGLAQDARRPRRRPLRGQRAEDVDDPRPVRQLDLCLVRTRTEGKAQAGISFLLIDMTTPGVTVHPIITLDGAHEVNEVWFDDVRVPVENLVGEENRGWTYAKFLLGHERTNIAGIGGSKRELQRLKKFATAETRNGRPLIDDRTLRRASRRSRSISWRSRSRTSASCRPSAPDAIRGPSRRILKIKGSEIQQTISELMLHAAGPSALADLRADAGASRVSSPLHTRRRWRADTSTSARPRSTAAPTRFSATSSPT